MKIKLFIDLDGTLLQTNKLKKELFDELENQGFNKLEINKAYAEECQSNNYTNEGFLKRLEKIKKYDKEKTLDLANRLLLQADKFVYKDTIKTLEILSRNPKYELLLLSLGNETFQALKAKSTGLLKYFKKTYFTPVEKYQYLSNLVETNEKFIMVDDRADALHNIKMHFPNSIVIESNHDGYVTDPSEKEVDFERKKIDKISALLKIL